MENEFSSSARIIGTNSKDMAQWPIYHNVTDWQHEQKIKTSPSEGLMIKQIVQCSVDTWHKSSPLVAITIIFSRWFRPVKESWFHFNMTSVTVWQWHNISKWKGMFLRSTQDSVKVKENDGLPKLRICVWRIYSMHLVISLRHLRNHLQGKWQRSTQKPYGAMTAWHTEDCRLSTNLMTIG